MELKWAPLLGAFATEDSTLVFKGQRIQYEGQFQPAIGNFIANRQFSGGSISADISFDAVDNYSACELIAFYDPARKVFLTAGLGGSGGLYSIRSFANTWTIHASAGDRSSLKAGVQYHVMVHLVGSRVALTVDGVNVLDTQLPVSLPSSQVGVWCMSESQIRIANFNVVSKPPTIFVVMEFTSPYNEIYLEVIKSVCRDLGVDAVRADEAAGPGVILADIVRSIVEAKAVIAEISPANPNVYYEVGYAHALGKPTILIADRSTKLPFDVSPFRVLFYDNTIPGRSRFEEGLKRHLSAIFLPVSDS
jgi:hypothetical protein